MRSVVACLLLASASSMAQETGGQDPAPARDLASAAAAKAGADRAVDYLVAHQLDSGALCHGVCESQFEMVFSVETFRAWQLAAHGLGTMALLQADETPARRRALDEAVEWMLQATVPLRGSAWDNDAMWAWLYGTVALTTIVEDPRFAEEPWQSRIDQRGRELVRWLEKNQEPTGGFGYYDDPTFSRRPKWGTSFCTACVLPALLAADKRGWVGDPAMIERAARYIERCRLPNGAYEYDLNPVPRIRGGEHINNVKGSLGRIQVCNWALFRHGDEDVTLDAIRTGLDQFFEHHEFLAIARMRPIPHEAYYANAGYFYYFGHYYCALCIELLPEGEREAWHQKLRPTLLRTQRADGSCNDFQDASYMVTSSTAFLALALLAGV